MYKKVAQTAVTVAIILLAALAVGFSAYGLYHSTNVAKLLNYQAGYQQAIVDVNAQIAQQQQAAQAQSNPETENEE